MISKPRVLVVGGGGFIGQHVVAELARERVRVGVMDLFMPAGEGAHDHWVVGTASDETLLAAAVAGVQTVIFLANASLPGSADADLAAEVNRHVGVTIKAAEICEAHRVERFIFASSGGTVYGASSDVPITEECATRPLNAYGVSKLAVENYLRILGARGRMRTVSLRLANPYGEGQRAHRNQGFVAAAMQHALAGETLPIWGDGSVERDFIHVRDVARAFARAAAYEGGPAEINVGTGRSRSLVEVLRRIEAILERRVEVDFQTERRIDVQKNVLDIGRARRLLGWEPQVALEDGLARTAAWWLESGAE